MKKLASIAVLLCAATLSSCGDEAFPDITAPLPQSQIKFFNFGVNAPGVHFYANNAKVAAVGASNVLINARTGVDTASTESTTGTTYGNVSAGGYYSAITPGSYDLTGRIAATTDLGLAISKVAAVLTAGKAYSYYISGAYDAVAKTSEAFVIEDNFPAAIDWSQAYVRFVNASPTSAPLTLYGTNTTTATPEAAIGAITAYKGGSAFVAVPQGSYNLAAKDAGGVSKITRTAVSFSSGRVYTITVRGTTSLFLDNTANR
jgi:hypothetical protein